VSFWRRHFLRAEFGLALAIAVGVVVWSEKFGGTDALLALMKDNRSAVYTTLTTSLAALLGFVITATSIAVVFSDDPRLNVVKDAGQYGTFTAVFVTGMRDLGIASVGGFLALLLDRDRDPRLWVFYVVVFASILGAFRVARCIWVLDYVLRLAGNKRST